jgi:RNA-directed DNA polymerase
VPTNIHALKHFRDGVVDRWKRLLSRRSQKGNRTWTWTAMLADYWIPRPRILHPWPEQRFAVMHPR